MVGVCVRAGNKPCAALYIVYDFMDKIYDHGAIKLYF